MRYFLIYILGVWSSAYVQKFVDDDEFKGMYKRCSKVTIRLDHLIVSLCKVFPEHETAAIKYLMSRCSNFQCYAPSHRVLESLEEAKARIICIKNYWKLPAHERETGLNCPHKPICLLHPKFKTNKETGKDLIETMTRAGSSDNARPKCARGELWLMPFSHLHSFNVRFHLIF